MNALSIANEQENVSATGEKTEPMLGSLFDTKRITFKPVNPYKELDAAFFSKQRKAAVTALKQNRNFRTLLDVAEGYFVKGVFPEAQSYYNQALEINPQLFLAYQRLKAIALKKNDLRLLEEYQKLLVENSNRRPDFLHEYCIMRAGLHPQEKKIMEQSLHDLNELLESEPNNAAYLNSRGFVLLNFFQDSEKAESDFRDALRVDPEQVDANNNLGAVLIRKNDFQGAIPYFESCIRISSKYRFSYQNLALCYKSMGKFRDALSVLKRASSVGVVLPREWLHLYGWLLIQAGDLVEAKLWYTNKIQEEPDNNLLYNNLGVCFLESDDIEEAILNFEKAIRMVKSKIKQHKAVGALDLHAFYNRGRVALGRGDRRKANEIRKNLIKINPDDVYALYLEGNNNLVEGKIQKALDIYYESIEKDPFLPDPYPDAAFILECHAQNYQLTISLLESAVSRGIKTALVLNNLAYAYIKAGQLDKADQVIRLMAGSKRPEFLATKGMLSFHRMNLEEGDRLYASAIEAMKDHEKPMATQLWHYEKANYLDKKGDREGSLREAKLAREVRSSYLNKDIQALIDKLTGQLSDKA